MKISVVTAAYYNAGTIAQALESVGAQTHPEVEHVVIDGAFQPARLRRNRISCLGFAGGGIGRTPFP